MPATLSPPSTVSPAPKAGGGTPLPPASVGHEPPAENYLGDLGPELEALDKGEPVKAPEPPKKPAAKPEPEAGVEPPEPTDDKPAEGDKPKEEPKKKGPFAIVREAKEALEKKRDHEWMPKIQSLEAKVAKYEEQLKAGTDPKVQERLTAIQKENDSLREELRFANYQKHPEYIEKFQKPLNEAWTELYADLDGFKLEAEDGTGRDITVADLNQLAGLPLKQRGEQARSWFGESAPTILQHIRNISELSKKNEQALEQAKKASADHELKTKGQHEQQNAAFHQAFTGAGKELVDKYPKWFGEREGDAKGNELLKKGLEYTDTVFSGNGSLNPQQKAQRLAVIRAKAANHDRVVYWSKEKDARIAELEEDLAKFEESEPPTTTSGEPTGLPGVGFDDIEAELKKMDR